MTDQQTPSLAELTGNNEFGGRHIGPDEAAIADMLSVVGAESLDDLIEQTVPGSIRESSLRLPPPLSEMRAIRELRGIADSNQNVTTLIGLGYHGTVTPAVIRRNVLENPAWYTAYTPYQPEISQGRLEALLNFQTMVADLAGMELANASLLDEGTAAAEAMTLLHRVNKAAPGDRFIVDPDCHPQTLAVLRTRAQPLELEIEVVDPANAKLDGAFGMLVQYPGSSGRLRDLGPIVERAHADDVLVAVAADPLALVLLTPPGELGADVVVGTTQRFGVPMGFGGPHAAYFATREAYQRSLPGRLVGVSQDSEGRAALRLALQTREQHIRREKATSNICTAQVLLAVIASMYAVHHGPDGLRRIAQRVHRRAVVAAAGLRQAGLTIVHDEFFDTVVVRVPGRVEEVMATALANGLNLRRVDEERIAFTMDEVTTNAEVSTIWRSFEVIGDIEVIDAATPDALPVEQRRVSDPLPHPVFSRYQSETELVRYLRLLADKDIALDRSMIPLGSCTMKLNAAAEMEPISWPGFAYIHPFAPADQAEGYQRLTDELEQWLVEITGYAAVSLQPNSGAQGELAGLLAIRAYHRSNGDTGRDVCLIPSSAHGTNAASAVMAGMRVVVVACDEGGNVDVEDLAKKCAEHSEQLSALMVTYPSTHGVFEERIGEICDTVHEHGGQVYLDGANLNAMVGVAKPGQFGADVSHLNLHKTFCIPHGGGGPGVGPIGVGAHLAPFLPGHPFEPVGAGVGPIAAAPYGSAGILPIPWMYLRMMGADSLRRATGAAILGANYIAARLRDAYPILYTGPGGRVAHECILDTRIFKDHDISVDDIAKRLMDYGFHAPTMSFPVAGTLMVEPTESESKEELDRFCDAMLAIRAEIDRVAAGTWPSDDNPLVNAPHTATAVTADEWAHPYPRSVAAYPAPWSEATKYWPPVGRIDGAFGDRHLVCSCPPLEELAEA